MRTNKPLAVASVVAAALMLAACGSASAHEDPSPASLRAIAGSDVKQVHLTGPAVQRLGIATQQVRRATVTIDGHRGTHPVIPYSAVVYDNDGSSWAFVNIAPLTYVRQPLDIAAIQGSTAVLVKGPALGAAVVTVGAPELLGTEYDISGEE